MKNINPPLPLPGGDTRFLINQLDYRKIFMENIFYKTPGVLKTPGAFVLIHYAGFTGAAGVSILSAVSGWVDKTYL